MEKFRLTFAQLFLIANLPLPLLLFYFALFYLVFY